MKPRSQAERRGIGATELHSCKLILQMADVTFSRNFQLHIATHIRHGKEVLYMLLDVLMPCILNDLRWLILGSIWTRDFGGDETTSVSSDGVQVGDFL